MYCTCMFFLQHSACGYIWSFVSSPLVLLQCFLCPYKYDYYLSTEVVVHSLSLPIHAALLPPSYQNWAPLNKLAVCRDGWCWWSASACVGTDETIMQERLVGHILIYTLIFILHLFLLLSLRFLHNHLLFLHHHLRFQHLLFLIIIITVIIIIIIDVTSIIRLHVAGDAAGVRTLIKDVTGSCYSTEPAKGRRQRRREKNNQWLGNRHEKMINASNNVLRVWYKLVLYDISCPSSNPMTY